MKILHAAALPYASSGICNQMKWEAQCAQEVGLDWDVELHLLDNGATGLSGNFGGFRCISYPRISRFWPKVNHFIEEWRLRKSFFRAMLQVEGKYDAFVIRYNAYDPILNRLLRLLTKPVFLVHHTLEIPEIEARGNFSSRCRAKLEQFIGPDSLRRARGIVGVTNEIGNYERARAQSAVSSVFIYPNGISWNGECKDERNNAVPEIVFVATDFPAWHGLDILLPSVLRSPEVFRFHIVGELPADILALVSTDDRIIHHRQVFGDRLEDLLAMAWVGLSSFALYRKGMTEACTLKVREYLRAGIPVYSGHLDVFPREFPYYRVGAAEFSEILEYARFSRGVSREEVRSAARQYIDKSRLLLDFHELVTSTLRSNK